MHLVGLLLLMVFVPFCISRAFNDPPPVDGEHIPVDGVGDEGTLKLVNGLVYKVDDEVHVTVDSDDPPPVDGEHIPVDGVGDEGTLKLVNGLVYKVDDEVHETVDSEDPMVDEMVHEKGPIKAEELRNIPYSKRKHP